VCFKAARLERRDSGNLLGWRFDQICRHQRPALNAWSTPRSHMSFISQHFSGQLTIDLSWDSKEPSLDGAQCLKLSKRSESLEVDWAHPIKDTTVTLLLTPSIDGFQITVQSWPRAAGFRRAERRMTIDNDGRMSSEEK
jgi:hypothetical protein